MMSKAQRIKELLAEGRMATGEIARTVGCRTSYVRVVRQRAASPGGRTAADIAWVAANPEAVRQIRNRMQRKRYRNNPAVRAKQSERRRAAYARMKENPEAMARHLEMEKARYRRRKEAKAGRLRFIAGMTEAARG